MKQPFYILQGTESTHGMQKRDIHLINPLSDHVHGRSVADSERKGGEKGASLI